MGAVNRTWLRPLLWTAIIVILVFGFFAYRVGTAADDVHRDGIQRCEDQFGYDWCHQHEPWLYR